MTKDFIISKLLGPHVLPPLPPFPKGRELAITKAGDIDADYSEYVPEDKIENTLFATPQVQPLRLKLQSENEWWLIPVEPMIGVQGKNILVKRDVAKRKTGFGGIKEYWTQGDWTININGLLTDNAGRYNFPRHDVLMLIRYCTAKEPIDVKCPGLQLLGITRIVIEDYQLPFTKGPENQNYSITAYSDTDWKLLLKKKTSVSAS